MLVSECIETTTGFAPFAERVTATCMNPNCKCTNSVSGTFVTVLHKSTEIRCFYFCAIDFDN